MKTMIALIATALVAMPATAEMVQVEVTGTVEWN